MGILIGCEHISHEWPGKHVLKDQSFGVNEGDRIGIVGRNGDGKSTLLRVLSGGLEPDDGSIVQRGGITVGMLGQDDDFSDDEFISEYLTNYFRAARKIAASKGGEARE